MADSWIVFVDTNIYLDFYRQSGESAERQLKALEKHKSRLIIGDQVRMEFLKNRQKVLVKVLKELKAPLLESVPQIISGSKPAELLQRAHKEAKNRHSEVKKRVESILADPSRFDKVFQTFTRIYDTKSQYNLCRPMKIRFDIRNRARKRFVLGYPPRKEGDTSIGDAINWEWIIECAKNSDPNTHVLLVSRDADYGAQYDNMHLVNDWLLREFKDRVSRKRKLVLTGKLTQALKYLDEVVKPEDEREEEKIIQSMPVGDLGQLFSRNESAVSESSEVFSRLIKAFLTKPPAEQANPNADL